MQSKFEYGVMLKYSLCTAVSLIILFYVQYYSKNFAVHNHKLRTIIIVHVSTFPLPIIIMKDCIVSKSRSVNMFTEIHKYRPEMKHNNTFV